MLESRPWQITISKMFGEEIGGLLISVLSSVSEPNTRWVLERKAYPLLNCFAFSAFFKFDIAPIQPWDMEL